MKTLITIIFLLYPLSLHAYTQDISQNIQELDEEIAATDDKVKRAQLYAFKARQYRKNKEYELSIKSYLLSIQQHGTGWSWLELGSMYFKTEDYEKSLKVANNVINKFPGVLTEAKDLLTRSQVKLHEIYLKENPPTIIVNNDYNPGRKTRFDVMNEVQERNAAAASFSRNTIYSNCKAKWGTDYSMVEYCIKKQSKANSNVQRHRGGIRARCEQKWGSDYSMVEYCIKKQSKANSNVQQYRGDIKTRCEQKWGKDYSMVEYCIKKQTQAKNNINR